MEQGCPKVKISVHTDIKRQAHWVTLKNRLCNKLRTVINKIVRTKQGRF